MKGILLPVLGIKVSFPSLPSLTPPWRQALRCAFPTCNLHSSPRKKPSRLLALVGLGLQYSFLWYLATVEPFLTKSFLFLPGCPFSEFWLERAAFCWGFFVFLSLLAFGVVGFPGSKSEIGEANRKPREPSAVLSSGPSVPSYSAFFSPPLTVSLCLFYVRRSGFLTGLSGENRKSTPTLSSQQALTGHFEKQSKPTF